MTEEKMKKFWNIKRITLIIVFLIFSIYIIYYKTQNPEFALGKAILSIIISLIIGGVLFFISEIMQFFNAKTSEKKEEKIPDPIEIDEMKEIIVKTLKSDSYGDHVKKWGDVDVIDKGKNKIYVFELETLYRREKCHFLINSNYPNLTPVVLFNNEEKIKSSANSLSFNKEEEPDKKITEIENAITGTKSKTIETTKNKKDTKKESEL